MKKTSNLPRLIVVLGPTAVGKSDLAVDIAKKVNGEVISADSRQVYKGLDIGSGKITKKEMRGVRHHCLDIVSPKAKKLFSVSDFQIEADAAIKDILTRGKTPILCGGTGFYIDAVVDGIVLPDVDPNPELRKKLKKLSAPKLVKMLEKLDPERMKVLHPNNKVRLIRAIEIAKAIGQVPKIEKVKRFEVTVIGLDTSDEILRKRIQLRVLKRIKAGMIKEAEKLRKSGVTWKRMREFGLEYGLLADLLQEKLTKEQFIERLTFDIWHYVRRQRAWFKRRDDVTWFDPYSNSKNSKKKRMKNPLVDIISEGLRLI